MLKQGGERGFTLIELLVVIAIIGLLAAVVLASVNTARIKGREAARRSDMHNVIQALELYANDHGGTYPPAPAVAGGCGSAGNCLDDLGSALAPQYMAQLPADPLYAGTTQNFKYCVMGSGCAQGTNSCYQLLEWDENNGKWCTPAGLPAQPTGTGCWYINGQPESQVTNPGSAFEGYCP